jgi:hypothetical protein
MHKNQLRFNGILSGEPQRGLLESILKIELKRYRGDVVLKDY